MGTDAIRRVERSPWASCGRESGCFSRARDTSYASDASPSAAGPPSCTSRRSIVGTSDAERHLSRKSYHGLRPPLPLGLVPPELPGPSNVGARQGVGWGLDVRSNLARPSGHGYISCTISHRNRTWSRWCSTLFACDRTHCVPSPQWPTCRSE